MLSATELEIILRDVFRAHSQFPITPERAFRRDGITPFGVHEALGVMLILHEEHLPERTRVVGAKVIAGHEWWEDTTAPIADWIKGPEPEVEPTIREMTYAEGQNKFVEIWKCSELAILCCFIESGCNLMVNGGRSEERKAEYKIEMSKLADHIDKLYPNLNIVKIVRALLQGL